MYIRYVLSSKVSKKSYVGYTKNLKKRLSEHNSGKNEFTSNYKPWEVIYTEQLETEIEAKKREKYLKSANGRRLILKKLFTN